MLIIQIENISQVLSAAVNGIAISNPKNISTDQAGDKWEMQFYAPPESGVNIMLEARSNEPVRMKIIDVSYELPSIPGHKFTIDQPDMKPGYFGLPDSTFISKSFSL